jgi:hypothetical protein
VISYAQTNIQLYNQLLREGYKKSELRSVRSAYDLATQLFTNGFRPSGKPFLAHLVGTASILVSLHAGAAVVVTGLLHAAYDHGEFGDGSRGATPSKRRRLQRAVGKETEELVKAFTDFLWNKKTIPLVARSLDTLSPCYRRVLLIRLANELEDYLDLGILYCDGVSRAHMRPAQFQSLVVEMSRQLGFPKLVSAFNQALREVASTQVPGFLRRKEHYSFSAVPASRRSRRGESSSDLLGSRWMV